jgi:ArsR family transcriptional regulator, arsenate/arsenite/antimonite-responsive transcriptional repressor
MINADTGASLPDRSQVDALGLPAAPRRAADPQDHNGTHLNGKHVNGQKEKANKMITKAVEYSDPEVENMPELAETTVKEFVSIFKLLSDETRLRILFYLTQRDELHVRALCSILGQSQPAVSHHLALLRVAGLIEPRRSGKHNYYHILPQRFQDLLDTLFSAVPEEDRRIRFENYVLSYSPVADVM